MAIKLVYQAKKEPENEMHLYGSLTNVPNTVDERCVYDVAFDKENQHYFYTKSAVGGIRIMGVNDSRRQIPTAEDDEMKVTCSGFDVLNGTEAPETKKKVTIDECPEHVIATVDKDKVEAGEEVSIRISFELPYYPAENTVKAFANTSAIALTETESNVFTGKFVVNEDVSVKVEAVVAKLIPVNYYVNGDKVPTEAPYMVNNVIVEGDGSEVESGGKIDFVIRAAEGHTISDVSVAASAGEVTVNQVDDTYVCVCQLPVINLAQVDINITATVN